jgi:hypothetical protein
MSLRLLARLFAAALPAIILWLLVPLLADDPVMGPARGVLIAAATIVTALLAIAWLGKLALKLLGGPTGRAVTGFQRVAVYGVLSFAIAFLTLRHFGFELNTILTTSALATAAIGFAMQPTLTSMIAGLALSTDRALHLGDTVMLDGRAILITAMGWRAASGRASDGAVMVIPNAKLSDAVLTILPHHEPLRCEFPFAAPAAMPGQVCALAVDVASSIAEMDMSRPADATLDKMEPDGSGQYCLRVWLRAPYDRGAFNGAFQTRFWHACRRHGIAVDDSAVREQATGKAVQLLGLTGAAAKRMETGMPLSYGCDEALVPPPQLKGARLLLVDGAARTAPATQGSSRPLPLPRLAAALMDVIGPYGGYAAETAATSAPNYEVLCRNLAGEIDDACERQRFLQLAGIGAGESFCAGDWLDHAGPLYADGEAIVFAVPAGVQN